ncbi:TetR/AcrR family transcriptional regulator [Maricaulis parjimensis]|uniref:TetR/AcrR family transcriptional regulator n=1 Tax=Maricaulis parjimensis TaxID=144023 RepID=UPI00193A5631|nr:TetR/AcrR family transcriptional regulator [Maricaulis parjimensis]
MVQSQHPSPSPETPSRRQAETDDNRRNILDVAISEFSDKGLTGARIDEIAERTRTSKRMIYYHFGSKEGLYKAALAEAYGRIRTLETEMDLDSLSPTEALRGICEFTFNYHNDNPEFVRLIMNENMLYGAHLGEMDVVRSRNRAIVTLLSHLIERGVQSGEFRNDLDPINLHMSISALCFHYAANRYTFSKIFAWDMESPEAVAERRKIVADIVERWCLA